MPPLVIGSNIQARAALSQLSGVSQKNSSISQQLSSGQRINSLSDDAAGLSLAKSLQTRASVLTKTAQNVSQGDSALSIAETALSSLTDVITSMSDLAEQATDKTLTRAERQALQTETDALTTEFNRIVNSAELYGVHLLDRSTTALQIRSGPEAPNGITTTLTEALSRNLGASSFTTGVSPGSIANDSLLIDLNSDGNLDVVHYKISGPNGVTRQLGTGTGSFDTAQLTSLGTTSTSGSLVAGDITGDGATDIVVLETNGINTAKISVLQNSSGSLSLVSSSSESSAGEINGIALADLNGDSKQDVIWGSRTKGGIFTKTAGSAGALGSSTMVFSGSNFDFAVTDFSGDGITDLLVGDRDNAAVKLLTGNGNGGFNAATTVWEKFSQTLVVGDFNRDGRPDVAIDYSTTHRILINSDGSTLSEISAIDFTPTESVDINSDGFLDLVAASAGSIQIAKGNGNGTFQSSVTVTLGTLTPTSFGDLNNDGVTDLVSTGTGANIQVYLQNTTKSTALKNISLTSAAEATAAVTELANTQKRIDVEIGNITSARSRLQGVYEDITTSQRAITVAAGRILDVNAAELQAARTAGAIRERSAEAVFAQANQTAPVVATLLRESGSTPIRSTLDPPARSATSRTLGPAAAKSTDTDLSSFGDPNASRNEVLPISDARASDIRQWLLKLGVDE